MTGITAYFGLLDIGRPEAGQTLIVTGAAGAVGSTACQIGKIKGLNVVGLAGSDDKCRWLEKEIGIDTAINYHDADVWQQLQSACPNGADIVFENVGGQVLDMALGLLNVGARVVLCCVATSRVTLKRRIPAAIICRCSSPDVRLLKVF